MTKTEELLKLATQKIAEGDSLTVIRPSVLHQLVELVRLQHEALKPANKYKRTTYNEAIAAYERFEKGEG